jgi:hypothetical protein
VSSRISSYSFLGMPHHHNSSEAGGRPTINFFLPDPCTSSESSTSSTNSSPTRINFHIPPILFIIILTNTSVGSGVVCRAVVSSTTATPISSNLTSILIETTIQTTENSPLNCTVLQYSSTTDMAETASVQLDESESASNQVNPDDSVDDDDDLSPYEDSDEEGHSEVVLQEDDATIAPESILNAESVDITVLAKSLFTEEDPHISAEEQELIINSSVNTKQYEKTKRGIEQHFFDTIDKFGGVHLRPLSIYADDGFTKEHIFYNKLRGEKTEEKRFLPNKCLVKIALKWQNQKKAVKIMGSICNPPAGVLF